jgi:Fe2+ or Zn2+ uptake regulation protein
MSKKKGLSFDDKRTRMLEIFTDSKTFFTLKELEKVAPKQKGIVLPSVKEVLQSLVDDDVVSSDKCGTQTVYWCLPSQAVQKKLSRIASLTEKLQSKSDQKQQLLEKREELRNCHQDTVCSKVLLYLFY